MFLDYWKSKRGSTTDIPFKADLDPIDMGVLGILPNIWLAEISGSDRPRYRLAGESINAVFHRSLRGASIDEVYDRETANRVMRRWDRMAREHLASVVLGTVCPDRSTAYLGERIILPARDDDGQCTFVIGVTDYHLSPRGGSEDEAESHFVTSAAYFVPVDRL